MAKPSNYWDKRAIKRLTDAEKQSEAVRAAVSFSVDQPSVDRFPLDIFPIPCYTDTVPDPVLQSRGGAT